jgi:hypothetical protein
MENSAALVRLGGVCGILFVVLLVPGVFAARPDVPDTSLSAQQALEYFDDKHGALMIGNGLSFIFAAFFFLWFLGLLHGVLRSAEGEESGLSSVALGGGVTFIALETAGSGGRDRPPSDDVPLRELSTRCSARLRLAGTLRVVL